MTVEVVLALVLAIFLYSLVGHLTADEPPSKRIH